MSWLTQTISSTLGRKLMMALTGLFLVVFLLVHLAGNLQLLSSDGGESFNVYAKFMTTNLLIKTSSYLLYATFIAHIVWSILLTVQNRKARGSEKYANSKSSDKVSWNSRNMGILGTIVLIFLVIHMKGFWYEMHWGDVPMASYDGEQYKDLYTIVEAAFSQWWYVALYSFAMLGLAFHLYHGFQSAFQTLGLNTSKYTPAIQGLGVVFSILVPGLFALIPIWMFLVR
jgi:succinate dehydrogenase / fumarate reductase cytochrome b subunit